MLTSNPRKGDRERFERAGFRGYLPKPVRPDELQRMLSRVLADGLDQGGILTRYDVRERAICRPQLTASAPTTHLHVLLAEDNVINQRLAIKLLAKLGCTVDLACTGVQAVAACERTLYDLVLMDCHMPELDGYQATAAIRRLASRASAIPIVAMTASAMDGDRERCLHAGMDDYLCKPLSVQDLSKLLHSVSDREGVSLSPGRRATHEAL